MDQNGNALLCDYGVLPLIRQVGYEEGRTELTSLTNTARYMAPELVEEDLPATLESDIYALGCIGYEVRVPSRRGVNDWLIRLLFSSST
jgi:serine/threonine protein kinase